MRSLLNNKISLTLALAVLLMVALPGCKGNDNKYVIDNVQLLNVEDVEQINETINNLDDKGMAQVAVITTLDLEGKPILDYATDIANQLGVGHKESNDGITIVIKPKTADSNGEAAIATGLGMEKILTNDKCKRLCDEVMIPRFKENRYGQGIKDALNKIEELLEKQQ